MAKCILIVDDDPAQRRILEEAVKSFGHTCQSVEDGEQALAALTGAESPDFDLMLLDLVMPGLDGMGVLDRLRNDASAPPVIVQTSSGSMDTAINAMRAGASDFVVKPVRFEELLARLNAQFRRHLGKRANVLEVGDLQLDPVSHEVRLAGETISLSRQEFRLLHLFMRRAGQVLPQPDILEHLYELDEERELNTVEVLIGRLRRKIGKEKIVTLRGLGYRFDK